MTTKHVKLIGKKKFATVAFDLKYKTFIVYIASFISVTFLSSPLLNIHLFYRSQIARLIAEKTPTKVFNKYVNFANIFSLKLMSKLLKHTGFNDHAIKLVNGQQPLYRPIYSLELIELESLKTYIKTNLANRLIKSSNLPTGTSMLFD